MLCLPGFTPVAKLAQATGDSDGCVVSSLAKVPCSESRFRFGSLPSSIHLRARVGGGFQGGSRARQRGPRATFPPLDLRLAEGIGDSKRRLAGAGKRRHP